MVNSQMKREMKGIDDDKLMQIINGACLVMEETTKGCKAYRDALETFTNGRKELEKRGWKFVNWPTYET